MTRSTAGTSMSNERMESLGDAPDGRRYSPSAGRNRAEILPALARVLPETGRLLEVAAGTGEHAVFFAPRLPGLEWLPTDRSETALASMRAWHGAEPSANLRAPVPLDIEAGPWPRGPFDVVLAINLLHISPWSTTEALFAGAGTALARDGLVVIYGAFFVEGRETAPSNREFDASLRERDPAFGVREHGAVSHVAAQHGLGPAELVPMPNNNYLAVWRTHDPAC